MLQSGTIGYFGMVNALGQKGQKYGNEGGLPSRR